jgi:hypothetical protein
MSSHFSCIGFPVDDMDGYWALAKRAAAEGERIPLPEGGSLARWTAGPPLPNGRGPEIWAQLSPDGDVVAATPFFSSGFNYRIAVTAIGDDPEEFMDGWIDGWLEPSEEDEPYSGVFPLRVGLVDYALSRRQVTTFPSVHQVELVALAHEAELFEGSHAYRSAPGDVYRMPLPSFVSTAHFGADEPEEFHEPSALASGMIEVARLLTNPVSERPFWWIRLATQGTTLHICADPETLAGEAREGQILAGSFWMLGRLLS